jgi:hypothetical protein
MLKNYFAKTERDAVNIIGLAFGICTCIVIFLVTDYKFSFDNFDSDGREIYRIPGNMQNSSGLTEFLNTDVSDVAALKGQVPGFEVKEGFITYGCSTDIPNVNELLNKFDDDNLCDRR